MGFINIIDFGQLAKELLQILCVLFTVNTLFNRYFSNVLRRYLNPRIDKILLFTLVTLISMLLSISISPDHNIIIDLRLVMIILASSYLGLRGAFFIALFTIAIRAVVGGVGLIFWSLGALFYAPVAYYIIKKVKPQRLGLLIATEICTIIYCIPLLLAFIKFPLYFSFFDYSYIVSVVFLVFPIAAFVLDWSFQSEFKYSKNYYDLQIKANIDGKTGLFNHRRFQEILDDIFGKTNSLALLMIDIDYFKLFNDTNGHQKGDLALYQVAQILNCCVRDNDIVARYGGEEFIVILPDTDLSEAAKIAERIRLNVEATDFCGQSVTVSIGVAHSSDAKNKDVLIEQADRALYKAKAKGRNRVNV